jgi:sodium-independent sulfate anion transporter 11
MIASLVILLLRLARPRGQFLGRVTVRLDSDPTAARDVYVPLTGQDGLINPHIRVERPSPGILLYRPGDSITYPNASVINLDLVNHAKEHTRKGKDTSGLKLEDRPWNEPGPSTGKASSSFDQLPKPVLRAIILDFSAVSQVDTSGLQSLLDAQNEIERYVDGAVDFHFAGILTPSIQRALIASGFGTGDREEEFPYEIAASFPGARSAEGFTPEYEAKGRMGAVFSPEDVEGIDRADAGSSNYSPDFGGPFCPVVAPSTPFFHLDLDSVVRIAEFGLRPHI